jgi:hypothetical protein
VRGWRSATIAVTTAFLVGGCVGSIDRGEFDDEVHARGGGLSQDVIVDAVDEVGAAQDEATVQMRSVTVMPGRVALEVRVPGTPEDVDAYTFGTSGMFGGGGLDGPEPVTTSATDQPLESSVFTLEQAGVERFDGMVDEALTQADLPGAYATSATIHRPAGSPAPQIEVSVTNDRRSVSVTFAADGTVLEVVR